MSKNSKTKSIKIFIAAGGSGGHINPAIAVAEELKKQNQDFDLLFICSRKNLDKEIIKKAGFNFKQIFTGKLRRYFSFRNFTDIFSLGIGFFQSIFLILKYRPKLLFSKGGFVSLPVGLAAKIIRIPIILHESDTTMGLANRIIAKWARKVLTTFPSNSSEIQNFCTGTPVRELIIKADAKRGQKFLNFKNKKPIIMVIGGSQGAMSMNEVILNIYEDVDANFVVIAGKNKIQKLQVASCKLQVFDFLNKEFGNVIAASDLVISRAGSNTLNEIASLKKPSILIPLPLSANNHQLENAKLFADKNAAILIEEKDLDKKLKLEITNLLNDSEKLKKISKNVQQFYNKDAAKKIVEEILKLI